MTPPAPRAATPDQPVLAAAGWAAAARAPLAGDASDRRFWRLTQPGGATAVLMETPPGSPDDPAAFVRVARHLTALGLSAPRILAAEHGLVLMEDLGDALYPARLALHPEDEATLYLTATEALAVLQAAPPLAGIPAATPAAWAASVDQALGWYGHPAPAIPAALEEALAAHPARVMILRDFHAGNLIWLPGRRGPARAGLLDFQGAQTGWPAYDLVSLLQDARRDVPAPVQAACLRRFADLTGRAMADLKAELAATGTLRALRILGVFARLAATGKPQYAAFRPRVWRDLHANLAHPSLAPLARAARDLPAPPGRP